LLGFLILIMNTLPRLLPPEARPIIYADDVLVLLPVTKTAHHPLLQQISNILTDWSSEVQIPINVSKSKLLRISRLLQP